MSEFMSNVVLTAKALPRFAAWLAVIVTPILLLAAAVLAGTVGVGLLVGSTWGTVAGVAATAVAVPVIVAGLPRVMGFADEKFGA